MSSTIQTLEIELFKKGYFEDAYCASKFGKYVRSIRAEFYRKKILKCMELEYQINTGYDDQLNVLYTLEKGLKDKLREKIARENNNGWVWITVNPAPKHDLKTVIKHIEKQVKRKCFLSAKWVYEQRGHDKKTMGKGLHVHILAKRTLTYKPCKIKENLKNGFKKLCNTKNPNLLDIQFIGDNWAKDKEEYILGKKTGTAQDGTEKHKKQDYDIIYRIKNNLKPSYAYPQK
ncbi:MAG: putative replication initiation protein [Circoviridae sp.]|nr:MAG: putative replication initiation protein [Circoviridae sp.]